MTERERDWVERGRGTERYEKERERERVSERESKKKYTER